MTTFDGFSPHPPINVGTARNASIVRKGTDRCHTHRDFSIFSQCSSTIPRFSTHGGSRPGPRNSGSNFVQISTLAEVVFSDRCSFLDCGRPDMAGSYFGNLSQSPLSVVLSLGRWHLSESSSSKGTPLEPSEVPLSTKGTPHDRCSHRHAHFAKILQ